MFGEDLKPRMERLERDVDALKRIEIEVMKNSLAIANLSEKVDARFASVDDRLTALDANIGRLQGFIYTILTIITGSILTVLVLPTLRANL